MLESTSKTDWCVIGFPKCGTTALVNYLTQLPKINVAKRDVTFGSHELHYFNDPTKNEGYLKSRYKVDHLNGHKTVSYIYDKNVLKKILEDNYDVKIIICTRNLIDVLWSWYIFHKRIAKTGKTGAHFTTRDESTREYYINISLDEYFDIFKNRLNHAKFLKLASEIFDESQIFIVCQDNLGLQPAEILTKLYHWMTYDHLNSTYVEDVVIKKSKFYKSHVEKNLSKERLNLINKYQKNVTEYLKAFSNEWSNTNLNK